jgi:hypothetical protein
LPFQPAGVATLADIGAVGTSRVISDTSFVSASHIGPAASPHVKFGMTG